MKLKMIIKSKTKIENQFKTKIDKIVSDAKPSAIYVVDTYYNNPPWP